MDTFSVPLIKPRYKCVVQAKAGMTSRDTPRSQSDGGVAINNYPVGATIYAFQRLQVKGVPYMQIVPRDPMRPEWMREAEADNSVIYLKVSDLYPSEPADTGGDSLVAAVDRVANAILLIAVKMQ
jgi:hypothetical protein